MTSDLPSDRASCKIRIRRILPPTSQAQLFARKKCYLGISLDNPVFAGEPLRAMLSWATERFEESLIIVGDYLSRFNERILAGCSEEQAGERAKKIGDSFLSANADIFRRLPADKMRLTRWKEHLQSAAFGDSKKLLDVLFESNEQFRAAVEHDARGFVERMNRRNRPLAVGEEQAIRLSCEYILEEIAVFSLLSESGWTVELYPGSELRVLAQVARGAFPHVPNGLKNRISVELKIEQSPMRSV